MVDRKSDPKSFFSFWRGDGLKHLIRGGHPRHPRGSSRGREIKHDTEIRIACAGRIGKVHADAVAATPGAELVAVADALPEAAAFISKASGAEVRTIDEIMNAGDIDAVLVTTPTDMHADMIELAALMIGFNRRFDPNFKEVRTRIDAGAIGAVEMVSITSRDPAPPPATYVARSGGMFRDMTIHDFDMAAFLLGEDPVALVFVDYPDCAATHFGAELVRRIARHGSLMSAYPDWPPFECMLHGGLERVLHDWIKMAMRRVRANR
jgi:hypothetical protein